MLDKVYLKNTQGVHMSKNLVREKQIKAESYESCVAQKF